MVWEVLDAEVPKGLGLEGISGMGSGILEFVGFCFCVGG